VPEAKPVNYYQNIRPEMLDFIPAGSRTVLDVGCGEGYFAHNLKQSRDLVAWGIEMVEERAGLASQKLDRVLAGDVADLIPQLPQSFFDVITFNDVLEHLVDPFDVLARIKRCLSPTGVVVSSIPNIRFYPTFFELAAHCEWEYEESGILDSTHLRFFTERSIRKMYRRLGYEVVRHEGINKLEHLPRKFWIANALAKRRFLDMQYPEFATVARPIRAAALSGAK
jgi:2-polyprenyl-3-methyl-5-hydroxy-6-metoxy-1,4-benzoquinol methylase